MEEVISEVGMLIPVQDTTKLLFRPNNTLISSMMYLFAPANEIAATTESFWDSVVAAIAMVRLAYQSASIHLLLLADSDRQDVCIRCAG